MIQPFLAPSLLATVALALSVIPQAAVLHEGPFELAGALRVPRGTCEIVAATSDGQRLVYTNSSAGTLGGVDLSDPVHPRPLADVELGGEPTSVAVQGRWCAVAVYVDRREVGSPPPAFEPGKLVLFDLEAEGGPVLLGEVPIGHHPDSVALGRVGDELVAVVAIENEPVVVVDGRVTDAETPGSPYDLSPPGTIQVVTVDLEDVAASRVAEVRLPETLLALAGCLWPADPQPEFVSLSGALAAVTLQENNGVAIVDVADPAEPSLVRVFSTGRATERLADLTEDGSVKMREPYPSSVAAEREPESDSGGNPIPAGLRFPDAVAFAPDGAVFYTADEGEFDFTGGRGWSAWTPEGEAVWDDAGELEDTAVRLGLYPDDRSGNKGVEIEGVTAARFGEADYAFLLAERGSFLAVYDVSDPRRPRLRQVLRTNKAPEGVVAIPERGLVVTACEGDGTLNVFRLR